MIDNKFLISSCTTLMIIIQGCENKETANIELYNMMSKEEHKCPKNTFIEIDDWGESGLSQSCKMKHGKFIGWEYGRIVEGEYRYGKSIGLWQWYDEKGQIKVIEQYDDDGKLLKNN